MPNSVDIMTGEIVLDADYVAPSFPIVAPDLRSITSRSRAEFCNGLKAAGILSFSEALDAAKGSWPAPFVATLEALPVEIREQIQITWASVQTIDRTSPLIYAMQAALGWTDEQVDGLFGITS